MLKKLCLFSAIITAPCVADQKPKMFLDKSHSKITKTSSGKQWFSNVPTISLNGVYQIPENTYHFLSGVFSDFYQTVSLNTSVTDSTFDDNAHYQLIAVPLLTTNNNRFQFELFANFSDDNTQHLSNVSTDNFLYNYIASTESVDFDSSNFAVGAGFSVPTSSTSKIKVIFSNKEMPGYGDSTTLLSFESKF